MKAMTWRVAMSAMAAILVASLAVAAAAQEKRLAAKLAFPTRPVVLFDSFRSDAKQVGRLAASDFPAEVQWIETSDNDMHHIRLVAGGPDYWVDGARVKIAGRPAVPLLCESDQQARPAHVGRELGEATKCKPKRP